MSTVQNLRRSNIARYSTYGLVILWYVIFVGGSLLEFGFGSVDVQRQAVRIGVASVVFIILLGFIRWFFETKTG